MQRLKHLWAKLSNLGADHVADPLNKEFTIAVNKLALAIALINATIGVASGLVTRSGFILGGVFSEILIVSVVPWLNYRGKNRLAGLSLYLIILAATFYFCCILGKLAEVQLMIVVLVGAVILLFRDKATQLFCIGIALATLRLVQLNKKYLIIKEVSVPHGTENYLSWAAYLVVVYLVYYIYNWYWKTNADLRKVIQDDLDRKAEENRTKDKFISTATHEMRVSFRSIFSIIGILSRQMSRRYNDTDMETMLKDLKAACKYSHSIIDNVFEYERRKANLKSEQLIQLVNLEMTLRSIIDVYRYLADDKEVTIQLAIEGHVSPHVYADEMKLRQIVTNLLHNAIKFTRNRTQVTVAATQLGRKLILTVEDCGSGIAEDVKETMYHPFVTKNPDGLGLGLYIVRELVQSQGGEIEAATNAAGGATFKVSLPVAEPISPRLTAIALQ